MNESGLEKKVLAFDFGASSGRAIIGTFDGNWIFIEVIHRFSNDPVIVGGTIIGIDTWGADFALLDEYGQI